MRIPRLPSTVRWAGVVLVAGAILVASVVDPPGAGLDPAGPFGLVGRDKWLHAVGYATLGWAVAYALLAVDRRDRLLAAALAAGYGLLVEAVQAPLPYRAFALADAAANAAGAAVGVLVWALVTRWAPVASRESG